MNKNILFIVFLTFIIGSVSQFSTDFYLVSLVEIKQFFSVSMNLITSTMYIYFLGLSLSIIVYGHCIDKCELKILFIVGYAIFSISHMLSFFADNYFSFIILRFIQGISMGISAIGIRYIPKILCNDNKSLMTANYIISSLLSFVPICVPYLVKYINQNVHWRYIFLLQFILGVFMMIFIYVFLPKLNRKYNNSSLLSSWIYVTRRRKFFLNAIFSGCTLY